MKTDPKNEIFISREELIYFWQSYRFVAAVLFCALFIGVLAFIGLRPHSYLAKGQFLVSSPNRTVLSAELAALSSQLQTQSNSGGISLLTSQQLLTEVIEEAGLQIIYNPKRKIAHAMRGFFEHLKTEIGILPIQEEEFLFSQVHVKEIQKPFQIILRFQNGGSFEILDVKERKLGVGKIGEIMDLPDLSMKIDQIPQYARPGIKYFFNVMPLKTIVSQLKKQLSFKNDRLDPATYHAMFRATHPSRAKSILNIFFAKYETLRRKLHLENLSHDIEEIQKQESSLRNELFSRLESRAKEYSNQIGDGQFIDAKAEIEILHSSKKLCLEKLLELEILLTRLEEKNSGLNSKSIDLNYNIDQIKGQITTIQQIQNEIATEKADWSDLYTFASEKLGYTSPPKITHHEEVSRLFAAQIMNHLHNKKELFEKTSQALLHEVQGKIDLTLGQNLLSEHYHKIFEIESLMQQLSFLKGELLRPDFEISSISSLLSDPFLQSLLKGTAELSLQLHDLVNHTSKEQERIRDSIAFAKQFLGHHLRQKVDLLELELELTSLRAQRIQNGMLEQIRSEKSLLEKRMLLVQQEVAELPNKWLLENYFEVESELSKNILKSLINFEQTKILEKLTFHTNFQFWDPIFVLPIPQKHHTFGLAAMVAAFITMVYLSIQLASLGQRGFPVSLQFLKANHLKMLGKTPQQQALWLASRYSNHPLVVALFADLPFGDKVEEILKKMGFTTILYKLGSSEAGEKNFSQKIDEFRHTFDFVLLVGDNLTTGIEKCALLKYCDLSLVLCRNQSILDFSPIFDWVQHKGVDHVAFTFETTEVPC